MFTGLISELGKIKSSRRNGRSFCLTISADKVLAGLKTGDSVAVNGACLTVTGMAKDSFTVDVMPVTAKNTVVTDFRAGDSVNLERSVRVGDRLDGHIVTGHVDFVGNIAEISKDDIAYIISIKLPRDGLRHIVLKGSVAVDGISLTVCETGADFFKVSVIPHTASCTTLGCKKVGDSVNVETDILGKYVEKLLNGERSNPNQHVLTKNTFWEEAVKNGF
ncbi:MAG: riboflavin synthase [Acidaminococcales bacterium]|jgi:riboflavin synthase|nr:riboflavin synthase [Acidaminococcales bacterium]